MLTQELTMGKMKELYIDYLNGHPEIDPYDQDSLREAHIMRNRYTDQINRPHKSTQEWREDLALLVAILLIAIIAVI